MNAPRVTVAIVPRERFGVALRSLDSILQHTREPQELVYVDGRSPPWVARGLRTRARRHGFQLIRKDRYLTPNEARNLALREVKTPYVVFIDNDALVTPGWLGALVECAEQTGAAIVGPLQLEGEIEEETIHMAGGEAHIERSQAGRTLMDEHRLSGRRVSDVPGPVERTETELIEFHCMLVRRSLFDEIGELDPELFTIHEHTDLCMLARQRGERIFMEPASVTSYLRPRKLALSDVPYFMLRWNDDWTRRSLEHFSRKWDLIPNDPGLDSTRNFVAFHRRTLLQRLPAVSRLSPIAGPLMTRLGPARRAASAWITDRMRARLS